MSERRAFSVSIFARHRGAILLIHHNRLATWLPVGGEIESGETPLEAARRELREETGLEGQFSALHGVVSGAPPGLLAYEEHLAGAKGRHLNFCFVADVERRDLRPNHEFSEWRWVAAAPAEAPDNVRALVGQLVASPRVLAERWLAAFNSTPPMRLTTVPSCARSGPRPAAASPGKRHSGPGGRTASPDSLGCAMNRSD